MKKIGIFFGSDTGNTEKVAELIHNKLKNLSEIFDIAECSANKILLYDFLIFGVPTWYYGELQCDWDDFIPTLKKMNFFGKKIALFGCGDQEDYSEYFCDALGIMYKILFSRSASFVGNWPSSGYNFISSKGLIDQSNFVGLPIDEDRQSEYTVNRVDQWVKKISEEIDIYNL